MGVKPTKFTSADVGASIPEDVKSDVNANDSLYKVGSPVVIKTTGDVGFVTHVARIKGGAYLYTVRTSDGVYITAKNDLQGHGDISTAVKVVNSTRGIDNAFQALHRQVTLAETLMKRGRTAYHIKRVLQDILKTLSSLVTAIPTSTISHRQLDSVARQYAQVLVHTQRNWKRGTEMQSDIDRMVLRTLSNVRARVKVIERLYMTRESSKRITIKGDTVADGIQPYTRPLSKVLHDIVQGAQNIIKEGQPVVVAGRVVEDDEDIRLVGLVVQVVSEDGKGFDPVEPDDIDDLAGRLDLMKPSEHRVLVSYAIQNKMGVPANVMAEYPAIQNKAVKAGILSIRRTIGILQRMMNNEVPNTPDALRRLIADMDKIPHLNDDAKVTLIEAQTQLEAVANGAKDVTLEDVRNTVKLVLDKQVATKIPDEETPSIKSLTVADVIAHMGLSHKRETATTLLKTAHRFPDEMKACIRKVNNARRSGLLSGRAEKALQSLTARTLITMLVKLDNANVPQAEVVAWLTDYLAPNYDAQGGETIKGIIEDVHEEPAPTGDIVPDWSAYAESLVSAIKSATAVEDEGIATAIEAIRMEAMDAYDAEKDAILAHIVDVENTIYADENIANWRERALQTATSFEQAVRQMQQHGGD